MKTPDNGWTVEVIVLDGRQWYEVKYHGRLMGGGTRGGRRGLVATIEEVQAILGEAFARLQ
jgi:hypothetical protein